jgi:DNA replication and repair protein RecF
MIESIILQNFRNYKFRCFHFDKKINFILGINGSGKTNLLEAISMLSIQNGIRGAEVQELNQDYTLPFSLGFETTLGRIGISNTSGAKKFSLENENIKFSKLSDNFQIIHLMPEDEFIFSASVSERRAFFDKIFSKIEVSHAENLKNYKNVCTERIKLLESGGSEKWISSVEKQIAELSILISINRVLISEKLSKIMQTHLKGLQGEITIAGYLENKIQAGNFIAITEEKEMCKALESARGIDKITGKTLTKFIKTNFDIMFLEKQILASRASSGEQKKMIFSILLACTKHLINLDKQVFVLVDEVISKLDFQGQSYIINSLLELPCQSFLTGTEKMRNFENINTIEL